MIEPLVYVFENLSDELIEGMVRRSTIKELHQIGLILRFITTENQIRWQEITAKTLNIGGNA